MERGETNKTKCSADGNQPKTKSRTSFVICSAHGSTVNVVADEGRTVRISCPKTLAADSMRPNE